MRLAPWILAALVLAPASANDPPPGAVSFTVDLDEAWNRKGDVRLEDGELTLAAGAALVAKTRATHRTLVLDFRCEEKALARLEVAPGCELLLAPGAGCASMLGRSFMRATPGRGAGEWQRLFVDVVAPLEAERRLAGHVTVRLNGELVHDDELRTVEPWPVALRVDRGTLRVRDAWLLDRPTADGWRPLFDGYTLAGWTQRGGKATFKTREGAIVGRTAANTPNSFLCTDVDFADFVVAVEFKVDSALNSGIQIRSQSRPDYLAGQVHGYQVEIDPSERAWTGGIYDEGRRGWIGPLADDAPARGALQQDVWNHLLIAAEGPRLRTWLNGVPAADLEDDMTAKGFLALQVHNVGEREEPLEVAWRGLWLREIPEEPDAADR